VEYVQQWLKVKYLGKWIGRGKRIEWPSRSPDLTLINFVCVDTRSSSLALSITGNRRYHFMTSHNRNNSQWQLLKACSREFHMAYCHLRSRAQRPLRSFKRRFRMVAESAHNPRHIRPPFCTYVLLSAYISAPPTGRISIKFVIEVLYENLPKKLKIG